jgi:hypothetical protein
MAAVIDTVEDYCRQLGMEGDHPLRLALRTAVEASETARETAEAAREAVQNGARGLTPEGEAELVLRIQETVAEAAADHMRLVIRRRDALLILAVAGALAVTGGMAGFGGWALGYRSGASSVALTERKAAALFRDGPDAARDWLTLAQNNNLPASLKSCTGPAVRKEGGRTVCGVPLWIDGVDR